MSEDSTTRTVSGAALAGLALAAIGAWAVFSNGAAPLSEEARLQVGVAAIALAVLGGVLFSPRMRFRAPVPALAGLGMLVLFAAWCGISIRWSLTPDLSWAQLNRWAAYALVVAIALVIGTSLRRAPERTALAILVVATATALYALGGKVAPWLAIPGLIDLDHTAEFSRLRAPLGYWNALALVCVLAVPVAVRLAADPGRGVRARSAGTLALLALAVALGLTYSRGGVMAALVAVAVLVAIGPDRVRLLAYFLLGVVAALPAYAVAVARDDLTTDSVALAERGDDGAILFAALVVGAVAAVVAGRRLMAVDDRLRLGGRGQRIATPRTAALAGAAALLIAVSALALSEDGVGGTLENRWEEFTAVKYDPQTDPARVLRTNSGNRWVWWREAVGAFWDRPVRGWGAGSFPLVHRLYRSDGLEVRQPHSVPLQFLSETGLVGGFLALGGLGLLAWAAAARLRLARSRERSYVAALLAACAAWGIHMWFDWDSDIPGVTLPLLVALGVLAARPPGAGEAVEAAAVPDHERAPVAPRAAGLVAGALVLAAVGASAYLPWLAEEKAAEAAFYGGVGGFEAYEQAAKRADEALQLNPLAVEPALAALTVAYRRGRFDEVADLLEEAVRRQPRNPDVWMGVFAAHLLTGDGEARIAAAKRVLELDPKTTAIPYDAVSGDLAAASASATGTPLVDQVLLPVPPPIGPPGPAVRPLIGPPRPVSSGGTQVEPVRPRSGRRGR